VVSIGLLQQRQPKPVTINHKIFANDSPTDSTAADSIQIDARALLSERGTVSRTGGQSMVRELQIMAVGLVFLFLGAIVVGLF
jgi:hypothetical protein